MNSPLWVKILAIFVLNLLFAYNDIYVLNGIKDACIFAIAFLVTFIAIDLYYDNKRS